MYKSIFIILFLAFISTSAMSQIKDKMDLLHNKKKMIFMPQAGVNFSKFVDEPETDNLQIRTGYHVGFFIRNNRSIYIQPGIFYSRQGNQILGISNINSETIRENIDFNVLRFPIFLGVKLLNIRAYTGPSISFLTQVQNNELGFEKDDFKTSILGLNIGVGFNIWVLSIDFNYEYGLSILAPEINSKANVFSVNIGTHLKF